MQARCKRVFGNAHTYHINAISISSDQETFISSDDLRVNLWHLDHTNQSFNVVDIKPPNMEDLTEASPPSSHTHTALENANPSACCTSWSCNMLSRSLQSGCHVELLMYSCLFSKHSLQASAVFYKRPRYCSICATVSSYTFLLYSAEGGAICLQHDVL